MMQLSHGNRDLPVGVGGDISALGFLLWVLYGDVPSFGSGAGFLGDNGLDSSSVFISVSNFEATGLK